MIALALASTLAFAGAAAAQSYNPRGNYANPDVNTTAAYKRKGPCNDPWVTIALDNVYGRAEPSKCNVALYNNGHWSDFNQLMHAVAKRKNSDQASSLAASAKPPTPRAGDLINKSPGHLVGQDGGTLVGNDGAGFKK
jgi:hypothetical protein